MKKPSRDDVEETAYDLFRRFSYSKELWKDMTQHPKFCSYQDGSKDLRLRLLAAFCEGAMMREEVVMMRDESAMMRSEAPVTISGDNWIKPSAQTTRRRLLAFMEFMIDVYSPRPPYCSPVAEVLVIYPTAARLSFNQFRSVPPIKWSELAEFWNERYPDDLVNGESLRVRYKEARKRPAEAFIKTLETQGPAHWVTEDTMGLILQELRAGGTFPRVYVRDTPESAWRINQ